MVKFQKAQGLRSLLYKGGAFAVGSCVCRCFSHLSGMYVDERKPAKCSYVVSGPCPSYCLKARSSSGLPLIWSARPRQKLIDKRSVCRQVPWFTRFQPRCQLQAMTALPCCCGSSVVIVFLSTGINETNFCDQPKILFCPALLERSFVCHRMSGNILPYPPRLPGRENNTVGCGLTRSDGCSRNRRQGEHAQRRAVQSGFERFGIRGLGQQEAQEDREEAVYCVLLSWSKHGNASCQMFSLIHWMPHAAHATSRC